MPPRPGPWLDPDVAAYAASHTEAPDSLLQRLVHETRQRLGDRSRMQISPDQGVLMQILVRLMGAREAIEIGTFTGYSALCVARALPADGHLLCCDVSEEWTAIGRRYWAEAGVADKIELRIGPALETLRSLPDEARFDVAFIDADKPSYGAYFDELVPRMRAGGLIMVDNTLWSGRVIDPDVQDADTVALRAFNDKVAADPRVTGTILTVRDGLTLLHVQAEG